MRGWSLVIFVAAACSSTAPREQLEGPWSISNTAGTYSAQLTLVQEGSVVLGYNVAAYGNGNRPSDSTAVCGQVMGSHVQLYLPPDSTVTFEGQYASASTIDGTLTTPSGSSSATLVGPPPGKYTPFNLVLGNSPPTC